MQKEYSCECCRENNKSPIAIAGPDQVITLPTDSVSLDGSASTDPESTRTSYLWAKISGSVSSNIIQADSSKTLLKSMAMGVYQFEMTVKDNGGLFAKDTVHIMVDKPAINLPPMANAGADQIIALPNNTTTLNGSNLTDPDNNITSYVWTKISGPSAFNITNINAVQMQVTNLVQGIYQFEFKVIDAGGWLSTDTMLMETVDTLNAREIIYNGGWGCNDLCRDGDVYWDSSPPNTNLYSDPNTHLEVSIRLDTSSVWIDVRNINSTLHPINPVLLAN